MTAFDTVFFETQPPEGLYDVDIGLTDISDFGHLHTFADMNSDKYTDMVTVVENAESGNANEVHVHIYDHSRKLFSPSWKQFVVQGCTDIRNIVVGRSSNTMRLFVTCTHGSSTVVKLVDRYTVKKGATGEDDFDFRTLSYSLNIEVDSQPFIADLNGDYLDDILYTETSVSSQILVAL